MSVDSQWLGEMNVLRARLDSADPLGPLEISHFRRALQHILMGDAENTDARTLLKNIPQAPEVISAGSLHFSRGAGDQSSRYPQGGTEGFLRDCGTHIINAAHRLESLFGPPLHQHPEIEWHETNLSGGMAMMSSANNAQKTHYMTQGHPLLILTGTVDPQIIRHELGHMYLGNALPYAESIQEAAALFVESLLYEPQNKRPVTQNGTLRFDYLMPQILSGKPGWGLLECEKMNTNAELLQIVYAAYIGELRTICDGDANILRLLQESKRLADTRPTEQKGGRTFTYMPRLGEWIEEMNIRLPDFRQRYFASGLGKGVPEDPRVVWAPDRDWGGTLAHMALVSNRPGTEGVGGTLVGKTVQAQIKIGHDPEIVINMRDAGSLSFSPGIIKRMLVIHHKKGGAKLAPYQGMPVEIIPTVPAVAQSFRFIWNDTAQKICDTELG